MTSMIYYHQLDSRVLCQKTFSIVFRILNSKLKRTLKGVNIIDSIIFEADYHGCETFHMNSGKMYSQTSRFIEQFERWALAIVPRLTNKTS